MGELMKGERHGQVCFNHLAVLEHATACFPSLFLMQGRMVWSDGRKYDGDFNKGKRCPLGPSLFLLCLSHPLWRPHNFNYFVIA
jgi:hypothetical protein